MTNDPETKRVAILLGGGAALAFLGLLLPWVSVKLSVGEDSASLTQSGIGTDDGKVILVLAVLLALIAAPFFTGKLRKVLGASIVALLLATVIALVGFADIADIQRRAGATDAIDASVGFGLYVTTAGGLAALLGSFFAVRGHKRLGAAATGSIDGEALPPSPPTDASPPPPPSGLPSEQPPPPPPAP